MTFHIVVVGSSVCALTYTLCPFTRGYGHDKNSSSVLHLVAAKGLNDTLHILSLCCSGSAGGWAGEVVARETGRGWPGD